LAGALLRSNRHSRPGNRGSQTRTCHRVRWREHRGVISLALLLTTPAAAPPPAPPKIDCADADHRALDFWIGDWRVIDTASGQEVAESRIEHGPGDCSISETYHQSVGPGGQTIDYRGRSFSAFNTADRHWKQFYVDTNGAAYAFVGGSEGSAMVMTALAGEVGSRMRIAPQPDGSVRQQGWATRDTGKSWQPGYDYTYRRRIPAR
jgi:hypothetical protein